MLAPIGSGFLAFGRNAVDRLEPLQVSWGYHFNPAKADERDDYGGTWRLKSFEFEGTRDPSAWIAIADAIEFQAGLGWDAVRARIRELADLTRERFDGLAGLRLTTPVDPNLSGAMTAFWWPPGLDDEALRRQLWERRIEALINKWPEGNTLRVSTHFYTTEAELERLAETVPELAKT
jgi:isopenicillin-N epimerase